MALLGSLAPGTTRVSGPDIRTGTGETIMAQARLAGDGATGRRLDGSAADGEWLGPVAAKVSVNGTKKLRTVSVRSFNCGFIPWKIQVSCVGLEPTAR